jgi:cytoskeletal protein RodZ
VKSLTALENDQLGRIPGIFYVRNYIKSYLNAIHADSDAFFQAHKEKIDAACREKADISAPYCTKLKYSRFKRKNIFLSALLIIVVFILGFYLVYTNRDDIFGGWSKQSGSIALPETGIDFAAHNFQEHFKPDRSPVNVMIEFSDRCWTQVFRGEEKIIEQTYTKGDKLTVQGYALTFYLGNPSGLRFFLNGKEVSYLRELSKAERVSITPANMNTLVEK